MKLTRLVLSLTIPLLFTVRENEVTFTFEVNYKNHVDVFNYLSKVENFPVLNPTIYRLEVISGDEEEFTIEYDECLSHFPSIKNSVPTAAILRVNATNTSRTHYEEVIIYNCPWIMSAFCLNEIFYQRMAIMTEIEKVFGDKEP